MGPEPWEVEVAEGWMDAARRLAMQFDRQELCLTGSLEGRAVTLRVVLGEHDFGAELGLEVSSAVRVKLAPTSSTGVLDGVFGQDVKVGDAALDAAARITSDAADAAVREAVPPVARPLLLGLVEEGASVLLGDSLVVRLPIAPADARAALERVAALARALTTQGAGPYR